jgi:hypothetical protein
MTHDELEQKLDRFLIFLSKSEPTKSLPCRNVAREVLFKILKEKESKDGGRNDPDEPGSPEGA